MLPPVPTVEVNQVLWDSSSMFICTYYDINDLECEHTMMLKGHVV